MENEKIKQNKALQEEVESMQKALHEQQCLFNRYQEELYLREEQLQKLEEEKVKEMNELLITKYLTKKMFRKIEFK